MKTTAARLTGIAIAAALTVICGWLAVVYTVAALGPDGAWTDVLGAVALTVAALGCVATALEGAR